MDSERPRSEINTFSNRVGQVNDYWDNGFYTACKVNEMSINLLIDSGSTSSLISNRVFKQIKPDQRPSVEELHHSVSDVNGSSMKVYGKTIVKLKVGKLTYNHPVIICDMIPDGILGQDFLLAHIQTIDYGQHIMKTSNDTIQCWTGGVGNKCMTCRITVREQVQVEPQSSTWVNVDISNKEHLSPIGHVQGNQSTSLHLMEGIVSVKEENIQLNILNCEDEPVTIHLGSDIGTCEPINEVTPKSSSIDRCAKVETTEHPQSDQVPDFLKDLLNRSSIHLSKNEKKKFEKLLIKYKGAFAKSNDDLGCTNLIEHHIEALFV